MGRPPNSVSKKIKKQALDDERFRNAIEGKFGQAKSGATPRRRQALWVAHQDRRYGLNCIMTKLSETSITSIAITFLVINLSTLLRQVNCLFLSLFLNTYKLGFILAHSIIKADIEA